MFPASLDPGLLLQESDDSLVFGEIPVPRGWDH